MATQNRYYSNTATVTTLTSPGGINSGALTIQVGATTGFPVQFPFILRIEPATTSEEVVLVTGGAGTSGNPYTVTRGYDGTTARAHSQGVVVKHGFAQVDFQDPQIHLNSTGPGGSPNPHGLPDLAWNNTLTTTISETTLGSSAASVVFSSIPSSYKSLRLIVSAYAVTATVLTGMLMQFNSDTGAHYGYAVGFVNNTSSTGSGSHSANSTSVQIGNAWGNSQTTIPGIAVVDIPLYASTSLIKSYTSLASASDTGTSVWNTAYNGGSWNSTAAINTITVILNGGISFGSGSFFGLYGVV
jgi:hypothetical protein